jgi:hypothetical protein
MRYGSCEAQAMALLTCGVIARTRRGLLVASSGFPNSLPALSFAALTRAIGLAPITLAADAHLLSTSAAREQPMAGQNG